MRANASRNDRRSRARLAKRALLIVVSLGSALALLEHSLEARDRATVSAESTFASVQGKRVRYLYSGRQQRGPVIVLVTGMTATLDQWDSVQRALSATAPVLSYDRAGTGFSDASDAHDALAEADELAGLLAATHTTSGCVVVGFSASAFVARVFASKYPKLVSGLVLLDPASRDDHTAVPPYRVITYRRDFLRGQVTATVKALFGIARLQQAIEGWHKPAATPAEAKGRMALASSHHWLAVAKDALSIDASSAQAEAAPLSRVSTNMLTTFVDPNTAAQQEELAHAMHATFRRVDVEHAGLTEARTDAVTIEIILETEQRARLSSGR